MMMMIMDDWVLFVHNEKNESEFVLYLKIIKTYYIEGSLNKQLGLVVISQKQQKITSVFLKIQFYNMKSNEIIYNYTDVVGAFDR